jgi:predicted DsbA family dithiol-disulfide isomerase
MLGRKEQQPRQRQKKDKIKRRKRLNKKIGKSQKRKRKKKKTYSCRRHTGKNKKKNDIHHVPRSKATRLSIHGKQNDDIPFSFKLLFSPSFIYSIAVGGI